MSTLDDWTAAVVAELGIADLVDGRTRDLVLDMTKDVAHGVARPAAPLTAYLMGLAAGRAGSADEAVALAARISAMALAWESPEAAADRRGRGPGRAAGASRPRRGVGPRRCGCRGPRRAGRRTRPAGRCRPRNSRSPNGGGGTLAAPLRAATPLPGFDCAAMDGYAVG